MPLFNLIVSIWQHNLVLQNTIGAGFTKSVFVYHAGTCDLHASHEEITAITTQVLELIKENSPLFEAWYKQAKIFNQEADGLLAQYQKEGFNLDVTSYNNARRIFIDNFGFCTILPYWILYSINRALEKGENREAFGTVLSMYEELKGETRYPQLVQTVISKYFSKAAEILKISPEQASCLHPDELGQIIAGESSVLPTELEKRMNWCAVTLAGFPYKVDFNYDQNSFSSPVSSPINQNVTELRGNGAFGGIVRGRVKIVNTIDDMKKFEADDILISIQSSPSLMPAIMKCSALVTDEGGIMCHASIISRELKKPCVIGTKIATKVLQDGMMVEVDADTGLIKILK